MIHIGGGFGTSGAIEAATSTGASLFRGGLRSPKKICGPFRLESALVAQIGMGRFDGQPRHRPILDHGALGKWHAHPVTATVQIMVPGAFRAVRILLAIWPDNAAHPPATHSSHFVRGNPSRRSRGGMRC